MARDRDKLTFNAVHVIQEGLLSLTVWNMFVFFIYVDPAPLFRHVLDLNTFVLIVSKSQFMSVSDEQK